jgi:hypothetical protein
VIAKPPNPTRGRQRQADVTRLDFADFVFICNLPDPFVASQWI